MMRTARMSILPGCTSLPPPVYFQVFVSQYMVEDEWEALLIATNMKLYVFRINDSDIRYVLKDRIIFFSPNLFYKIKIGFQNP